MLAYLTTIITIHSHAKVFLYTDSQVTIQGYHHFSCPKQITIHKREKFPNYTIWTAFHYIVQQLDLHIKWIKVKAYNGIR